MASPSERQPLLSPRSEAEDVERIPVNDAEETTFSASIMLLVRDSYHISRGSKHHSIRILRIALAMTVMLMLVALQVFLLIEIKIFVTSPAVLDIRKVYNAYEEVMYSGAVKDSGYGFSLGLGGPKGPHFNMDNFKQMPAEQREIVCSIPFSQPEYLGVILLIWSLTVIGEIKTSVSLCRWLWSVPMHDLEDGIEYSKETRAFVLLGLPPWLKSFLSSLLMLRLIVALFLGWLGCRWLASTLNFAECLINAVALEFVIALNVLLYSLLMSDRNKRELLNMKLSQEHEGASVPSAFSYFGTFGWGLVAILWVVLYIYHFQLVLPGYQWDVRGVCTVANADKYNFWRI